MPRRGDDEEEVEEMVTWVEPLPEHFYYGDEDENETANAHLDSGMEFDVDTLPQLQSEWLPGLEDAEEAQISEPVKIKGGIEKRVYNIFYC